MQRECAVNKPVRIIHHLKTQMCSSVPPLPSNVSISLFVFQELNYLCVLTTCWEAWGFSRVKGTILVLSTVYEHCVWFGGWTQGCAPRGVSQACSACHYNNTWRADRLYLSLSLYPPQCPPSNPLRSLSLSLSLSLSASALQILWLTAVLRPKQYQFAQTSNLWQSQQTAWVQEHIFSTPILLSGVKFLENQRPTFQLLRQNEKRLNRQSHKTCLHFF